MQSSERKAAAVRPTSAQQVNQVKPMRVTRTARVMPEPQQETQDSDRPGMFITAYLQHVGFYEISFEFERFNRCKILINLYFNVILL